MSVLGIIEEKQRIPAQTGPQPPGSLSHTDTNTQTHTHLSNWYLPFFMTSTFPVPRDG